ncbi:hypothetical protein O1M63_08095 [Streptomyces mirabilis]|nr:hypothetical protein [Streptomyces mirabilis]
MADELDILRRANPVPATDPASTTAPRPARAAPPQPTAARRRAPHGPRPLRRWVWSVGTAAAVGVVVLTLTLSGSTTIPAVAAPRPLIVEAGSTPYPWTGSPTE